jgi:alkane 1-monooxygenase
MVTFRYLTPFAFLALVPLSGWAGEAWLFVAALATPIGLVSLDSALGKGGAPPELKDGRFQSLLPAVYLALQIATTIWAALRVSRPSTSLLEAAGLAISLGLMTGVFGFVAAHNLIHSSDRRERALGLTFLATVLYMHFRIAHVYGHHRRAATFEDPASARSGEGLYAFLVRSISGQFREAWRFEARRCRRSGRLRWNRMAAYLAVEILLLFLIALVSVRALIFLTTVAFVAVVLLESFNYVAHYGLRRRILPNGRPEPLGPHHSWNSANRMNNAALFNMGRHGDHHRRTTRSYDQLEPIAGSAELPGGYAAAITLALVPPLWRRVMDPRVETAMASARHRDA